MILTKGSGSLQPYLAWFLIFSYFSQNVTQFQNLTIVWHSPFYPFTRLQIFLEDKIQNITLLFPLYTHHLFSKYIQVLFYFYLFFFFSYLLLLHGHFPVITKNVWGVFRHWKIITVKNESPSYIVLRYPLIKIWPKATQSAIIFLSMNNSGKSF